MSIDLTINCFPEWAKDGKVISVSLKICSWDKHLSLHWKKAIRGLTQLIGPLQWVVQYPKYPNNHKKEWRCQVLKNRSVLCPGRHYLKWSYQLNGNLRGPVSKQRDHHTGIENLSDDQILPILLVMDSVTLLRYQVNWLSWSIWYYWPTIDLNLHLASDIPLNLS